MTKKYRLLIDSPQIKIGTQVEYDQVLGMYKCVQGKAPCMLLHPTQIENNPTAWGLIEEPKQSFKRWRAEEGKKYYHVYASDGRVEISCPTEHNDSQDQYYYLTGNYFQTEQEAKAYKARQEAIGRVTHAIIEANEGWEPEDDDIMWTISWNTNGYRPLNLMHNSTMLPVLFPWMNTRGIALSIISSHKEDLDLIFNMK